MFGFGPPKQPDPPPQQPQSPGIPTLGGLTDEERANFRAHIGRHIRILETGATMTEGFNARYMLETTMLLADIQLALLDEIKGLREDLALAQGAGKSPWIPRGSSSA